MYWRYFGFAVAPGNVDLKVCTYISRWFSFSASEMYITHAFRSFLFHTLAVSASISFAVSFNNSGLPHRMKNTFYIYMCVWCISIYIYTYILIIVLFCMYIYVQFHIVLTHTNQYSISWWLRMLVWRRCYGECFGLLAIDKVALELTIPTPTRYKNKSNTQACLSTHLALGIIEKRTGWTVSPHFPYSEKQCTTVI